MTSTTSTSTVRRPAGAPPRIELMPPSITLRVGQRRLTLSWRPRKALPRLLSGLLRRSWQQVLAPTLRVSVAAAAVCGAWQAPVMAAAPAPGTLPAGWSVVNGNVTFSQNGNTLNINQLSPQAIASFQSFSIGAGAAVNISQPGAAAALLAKVSGADISQIYGKLSATGTVVLYNPNGVVIGPGGVIDAARFIATTLNINDSDFLAGKLTFAKQGIAGAIDNQGSIQSATGGSVYLIGSSVSNSGIIKSPRGEVILAAGETVTLADTATPGVTVNVTGSAGNVTNLGAITAEAGRIGVAAGLISNSGSINASSVVREGGRIFLRASRDLATTASSSINADGTAGGNVTLYAQNKAFIDGDVSATGAPGRGGFVETSGLKQLDVVKVPRVGAGGTWLIDPFDLEVVSANGPLEGSNNGCGTYAVTSSGGSSRILNSTINTQLNGGVNVNLTTGSGPGSDAGNIIVSADIVKTSGGSANLTLNAINNISINANITSSSGGLNLTLKTGYNDMNSAGGRSIAIGDGSHNARILLNGGTLTASDGGEGTQNGNLLLNNGSITMGMLDKLYAGNLTVGGAGAVNMSGNASLQVTNLSNSGTITADLTSDASFKTLGNTTNSGTMNLAGDSNVTLWSLNNSGTINSNISSVGAFIASDSAVNSGTININGSKALRVSNSDGIFDNQAGGRVNFGGSNNQVTIGGYGRWENSGAIVIGGSGNSVNFSGTARLVNQAGGSIAINAGALNLSGAELRGNIAIASGGALNLTGGSLYSGLNFTGAGNMSWTGNVSLNANLTLAAGGPSLTLDGANGTQAVIQGSSDSASYTLTTRNNVTVQGGSLGLLLDNYAKWDNYGTVNVSGVFNTGSSSTLTNKNGGTLNYLAASQLKGSGSLVNEAGGNIVVASNAQVASDSLDNSGNITLNGGTLSFNSFYNNAGAVISGNGTLSSTDTINNDGTLAPGGDGVIGSMTINGRYSQSSSGILLIDIAGPGSTDQVTFGGTSTYFGGTLKTRFLGGYTPAGNDSFQPFTFLNNNRAGSSYFRTVTGDVITTGGSKKMVKAVYDGSGNVSLAFMGAQTFYAQNSEADWSNRAAFNALTTYMPTQIDTVVVNSSVNARYTSNSGSTTYDQLVINNGGTLRLTGGNLTIASGATVNGTLNVTSSSKLNLNGTNNLGGTINLTVQGSNAPTVNISGTTNITGTFNASAGTTNLSGATNITGTVNASAGALNLNGTTSGNGSLAISGSANVTIANALSKLNVTLGAGNLTLTGNARFDSLAMTGGNVVGNAGSRLNVAESFSQTGGVMTLADAALSQANGTLTVGNITADNLVLESQSANIAQASGTSLRVKKQLLAAASSGITLTGSGNQIAGFAANNSGTGNIALTNRLNTSDASVVTLNGINTASGNISIDNTGGMTTAALGSSADFLANLPTNVNGTVVSIASKLATLGINNSNGQIKAASGSVSLVTHSPLTIGVGGVSASGNIVLTAGASSGNNDTLVVNGVLVSQGGNITLSAGDAMTINANISTSPPGIALLSVESGAVIGYAQGVSITDVNGTRIPVTGDNASSGANTSQTQIAVQQQQNQQTQNLQNTVNNAQLADTGTPGVTNPVQQISAGPNQTVGGTAGNFGDEGENRQSGKKPLPMCT